MVQCDTHGEIKGTEGTINLIVLLFCLQCQQVESFGYYDNSKQVGTRMTSAIFQSGLADPLTRKRS